MARARLVWGLAHGTGHAGLDEYGAKRGNSHLIPTRVPAKNIDAQAAVAVAFILSIHSQHCCSPLQGIPIL